MLTLVFNNIRTVHVPRFGGVTHRLSASDHEQKEPCVVVHGGWSLSRTGPGKRTEKMAPRLGHLWYVPDMAGPGWSLSLVIIYYPLLFCIKLGMPPIINQRNHAWPCLPIICNDSTIIMKGYLKVEVCDFLHRDQAKRCTQAERNNAKWL